MIKTEHYMTRPDGVELLRTYSDAGRMIRQDGTGELYAEAVDPAFMGRTYTETEEPVVAKESEEEVDG